MQDRVPVQFFHYPLIVHHRCHHLPHFRFQVYYNVGVVQEARVAEKQVEQEESAKVVAPNAAPNASPHSAFQFSALCSRKIEVYISDKCI